MAVLFPGKFIYLATPHTASIATVRALAVLPGAVVSDLNEVKDLQFEHTFPGGTHHSTLEDLKKQRPEYIGNETTVTTIRNPYDLLVTWWLRQRRNLIKTWGHEPTFREYVEGVDETTSGGPTSETAVCSGWMSTGTCATRGSRKT